MSSQSDLILGPGHAQASDELVAKARKFGITVSYKSEESNDWRLNNTGGWVLNADAEQRLRKEVRAEQWAHNDEWRKWVTLVLAILGFVLGFWSLTGKPKQADPPCPRNYYRNDAGACVFALSPQGQPSQSPTDPQPSTPALPKRKGRLLWERWEKT